MSNKNYEDLLLTVATAKDTEAFNALITILKRLRKSDRMEEALEKIIDMQRRMARDRFGNESIADSWAEVVEAQEALDSQYDY